MEFTPRTTAPTRDNKYFYDDNIYYLEGWGMPNCTCYAWGRFYEVNGQKPTFLGNAEDWYGKAAKNYKLGQKPKVGAVICWRKGVAGNNSDGAGHVAVVEKVNADGSILISQSAYNGTNFWTQTLKPPYIFGAAYTLQGFIYSPIEFEKKERADAMIYNIVLTENLAPGSKGEEVKLLQMRLAQLSPEFEKEVRGHSINPNNGLPDGIWGGGLSATVKKVQQMAKIPVTGQLDKATRDVLNTNALVLNAKIVDAKAVLE